MLLHLGLFRPPMSPKTLDSNILDIMYVTFMKNFILPIAKVTDTAVVAWIQKHLILTSEHHVCYVVEKFLSRRLETVNGH